MRLWADTETRSRVPIKQGVAKYSTDVEVIIVSWAVDDGPVHVAEAGCFAPFIELVERCDELWFHNAEFDTTVLEQQLWWPIVPKEKIRCTMALARMHGLPGGLDKLCEIFHIDAADAKHAGKEHIQQFCVPNKKGEFNRPNDFPESWARFMTYAGQDVVAMRAIWSKTPKWNATPRLWSYWHQDQRMNARGVAMDLRLCEGAVTATTRAKQRLKNQTSDLTLGTVESTTQRAKLLEFLKPYGVNLPDLKADTVERRLADENLPEAVKELLRVRQQASKASTAKYQRVLNQHVDGRLHNLLVFFGAARTGRFAGRTIQPQNLPRPKHKQWEIDCAIKLFRIDEIELYDPDQVLALASSCLRGIIIAAPKHKLVVADLANIEGRIMAWVAGEDWKITAFRNYDAGIGPDLYKVAYGRAFNIKPEAIGDDDHRRQIGKVMELALQYYGGVGAFCAMAETYRLNLDDLASAAWGTLPRSRIAVSREHYQRALKRRRTYGLSERNWLVCESLVGLWRSAHGGVVQFWRALDEAVKGAVRVERKVFNAGPRIQVDRVGAWLRIKLPSGRYLSYPAPRISIEDNSPSFIGVDPYTKQWGRVSTYSGKLAENIVQAIAADILLDGLYAAERASYRPVLSVHDELICEPPDDPKFSAKGLSQLMTQSSLWAAGLPLAAKGWEACRYRK